MKQLELFTSHLPHHVWAKDEKDSRPLIRNLQHALEFRYITPNHPSLKTWMVFDVDRPGSAYDWEDCGVAPPNIIATNRANGHSHLFYGLEFPIRIHDDLEATSKALRYGSAVERGMRIPLGADASYNGQFAKNPTHVHWEVRTLQRDLYTLELLCDYPGVKLTHLDRRTKVPEEGLGRNCSLFDQTRKWAYSAVRGFWSLGFESWHMEVRAQALEKNTLFDWSMGGPLPHMEVRNTAKSIAVWVWENMGPQGFSNWQKSVSEKGLKVRRDRAEEKLQMLLSFGPGFSTRELSRISGIPQKTVSRLLSQK